MGDKNIQPRTEISQELTKEMKHSEISNSIAAFRWEEFERLNETNTRTVRIHSLRDVKNL